MQRIMLKSKIHRATLTATELNYEGSIAIDGDLLREADLLPGEQVHVLNLNNGKRLITYVIEAPAGSGTVMLNGPAAQRTIRRNRLLAGPLLITPSPPCTGNAGSWCNLESARTGPGAAPVAHRTQVADTAGRNRYLRAAAVARGLLRARGRV